MADAIVPADAINVGAIAEEKTGPPGPEAVYWLGAGKARLVAPDGGPVAEVVEYGSEGEEAGQEVAAHEVDSWEPSWDSKWADGW